MRRLGFIEVALRSGLLVVKPRGVDVTRLLNSPVYDESYRRVGRIVDVIGRVDDPRVIVKLESGAQVSSSLLYYSAREKRRGRRR
ncbi:MAG: RNA-binding protein [Desulfurococcus sp.]|nr:RNA-binding protein [Desulfurococcus sp.]